MEGPLAIGRVIRAPNWVRRGPLLVPRAEGHLHGFLGAWRRGGGGGGGDALNPEPRCLPVFERAHGRSVRCEGFGVVVPITLNPKP